MDELIPILIACYDDIILNTLYDLKFLKGKKKITDVVKNFNDDFAKEQIEMELLLGMFLMYDFFYKLDIFIFFFLCLNLYLCLCILHSIFQIFVIQCLVFF